MATTADFIFLHGGGQGSWVWTGTIEQLQRRGGAGRVLNLDVPGCGAKRDVDTDSYSFADIIDELEREIAAAALDAPLLVGHSQAGCLMTALAERDPKAFRRFAHVATSSPADGKTVGEMIGRGVVGSCDDEVGWPVDPATCSTEERNRAMFCNDMDEAQARQFLGSLGRDNWPMASYTQRVWSYDHLGAVPSTYIKCLADGVLPCIWQDRFAERFHCEHVVEVDAGHQIMNTQPERLAELLLAEAARQAVLAGHA